MSAPATKPSKQIPALREKTWEISAATNPAFLQDQWAMLLLEGFCGWFFAVILQKSALMATISIYPEIKVLYIIKKTMWKHKKHNHLLFTTLNCPYNTKIVIIIIIILKKCLSVTWINSYIQKCFVINHSDLNCVLNRLISFWLA